MRIFISHSQEDKAGVDCTVERPKAAGHDVWIDQLKLKPGDNISRKIQEGVATADAVSLSSVIAR